MSGATQSYCFFFPACVKIKSHNDRDNSKMAVRVHIILKYDDRTNKICFFIKTLFYGMFVVLIVHVKVPTF